MAVSEAGLADSDVLGAELALRRSHQDTKLHLQEELMVSLPNHPKSQKQIINKHNNIDLNYFFNILK